MILETPPPVATNQSTNTNGQSNNQSAESIKSANQSGSSCEYDDEAADNDLWQYNTGGGHISVSYVYLGQTDLSYIGRMVFGATWY